MLLPSVDQQQCIEQLVYKFQISDCMSPSTAIEPKLNLEKSSEICLPDVPYQKLIGSLIYLAVLTRPDIAYSVSHQSIIVIVIYIGTMQNVYWDACNVLKIIV